MDYKICETCFLFPVGLTKAECASWVQAIGSVGAIFIAVVVFKYQQIKEDLRTREVDRLALRKQLIVLKWIFITIADECEKCSQSIHKSNVSWALKAAAIDDVRKILVSISLNEIPDGSILLRVMELSRELQTASSVVYSLSTPRSKEVREMVVAILKRIQEESLTGCTEVTRMILDVSSEDEVQNDWKLFDLREKHRELTLATIEKLNSST